MVSIFSLNSYSFGLFSRPLGTIQTALQVATSRLEIEMVIAHLNGRSLSGISPQLNLLYIDLRPGQICHSKVMHRKQVTHSYGSHEKKSRNDNVGQGKIPWYTHRPMHRKRVTCELHDSYFCLMPIKHVIPKIEWTIEIFYNSVERGSQLFGDQMI